MEQLTFEKVDAHVQKNALKVQKAIVPVRPFAKGSVNVEQAAKLNASKLKTIYAAAKPILQFAMFILPSKWKSIVQALIAALDVVTADTTI